MTTPSTEWPLFIEYVSKIHAITRASVPTSGAGMSFSGPISLMISLVKRRVMRSSSRGASAFGSTITPPFAPPNGMPIERALPRHPHRERLDLVERDVGVVADAALRRAARDVVRDAVAREDLRAPVVHLRRDRDLDRLLALREDADQVVVDPELVADAAQLLLGDLERVLAQVRGRRLLHGRQGRPSLTAVRVSTRNRTTVAARRASGLGRPGGEPEAVARPAPACPAGIRGP